MRFWSKEAIPYQTNTEDVVIARVVKARGTKGEVACDIESDFPERFDSLEQITLLTPAGQRLALAVESCWFHQGRVILKFAGCDTMTAAQGLVGSRLVIHESQQVPLEDGEFYEHQLLGAEVTLAGGRVFGRVVGLMRTGGTDNLIVDTVGGRQCLIPFADDICTNVDVEARRIRIDPPQGLLEL